MSQFPASPYKHVSGLSAGDVRSADLGHPLYRNRNALFSKLAMIGHMNARRVQAKPDAGHGSLSAPQGLPGSDGVRKGLDYFVTPGDVIKTHMPEFIDYVNGELRVIAERLLGIRLVALDSPMQTANVNIVLNGVGGYEWHYDPVPVTGVLYLTDHPDDGGFCYEDARRGHESPDNIKIIQPRFGLFVVGDLSQTPHCVLPLDRSPYRVCAPVAWGVEGASDGAPEETGFLYDAEKKK